MDRLKDFLQWNLDNLHNLKAVIGNEDEEDTLHAMKVMIELFNHELTADDIKDLFIVISEDGDDADDSGISVGILRNLIQFVHYRDTGLTPEQIQKMQSTYKVWHNVADGDLPPEPEGNAEYYYTVDKYGRDNIYPYDDGFFKGSGRKEKKDTRIYLADDNIVAWIERPKYEGAKDET